MGGVIIVESTCFLSGNQVLGEECLRQMRGSLGMAALQVWVLYGCANSEPNASSISKQNSKLQSKIGGSPGYS
jgi:hypothetical protein